MRVSSPCAGVTVLRARTPIDAVGFADEQFAVIEPLLRRSLSDRDVRQAVAWFYTPMALPLLKAVHAPRAVVYDCLDERSASDFASPQRLQREAELLDRADLVLTGGTRLYKAQKSRQAHVHFSPVAGTSWDRFADAMRSLTGDDDVAQGTTSMATHVSINGCSARA